MSKATKIGISWSFILITIAALVLLDVVRKPMKEDAGTAYAVAEAQASVSGTSTVAIVRSDNARLPKRMEPDTPLTEAHVEALVREACRLADIENVVRPEHRWIAIKPNIVELKTRGSGVITDWRVVKAVVKIVHEIAPEARISIAEGGAWVPPDRREVLGQIYRSDSGDGFEIAGFRGLLRDKELSGVRLDIVDLNFDDVAEIPVPGGGYNQDTYFMPKTVRECDVLIDVPVLKVITSLGMTNAMKNFVGIAPGLVYGWSKSEGYPPGSGNPGIPHTAPMLDETIVELTALSGVDFVVVDAIVGMERDKTDERDGVAVRMNTILAGSDVVAVDAVSARLIGLNPDDVEYITLGSRHGLGISDLDRIEVRGGRTARDGPPLREALRGVGRLGRAGALRTEQPYVGAQRPVPHEGLDAGVHRSGRSPRVRRAGRMERTPLLPRRQDRSGHILWGPLRLCGLRLRGIRCTEDAGGRVVGGIGRGADGMDQRRWGVLIRGRKTTSSPERTGGHLHPGGDQHVAGEGRAEPGQVRFQRQHL